MLLKALEDVCDNFDITKREKEIIYLMCQGFSATKISEDFKIEKTTIYKHIRHIYEKMEISNQVELLSAIIQKMNELSIA